MYIGMNRFKVLKDRTSDFESAWLNREIHLHEVPGFISFHLLKVPSERTMCTCCRIAVST